MANSIYKHVLVKGVNLVIPQDIHRNIDEQIHLFNNNQKKLERAKKIIGYGDIYKVPDGITTVDLCEKAAKDLIKEMQIDVSTIDVLIFISQTPDYVVPPSSQVLHRNLGLSKSCAVFDLTQGCTGYIYGLWVASSLIESRVAKRVLLCVGEHIDIDGALYHRGGNLIFSDAGSATIIDYTENENISYYVIGSDGTGCEAIIAPAGQARMPISHKILDTVITDKDGNDWQLFHRFMDGLAVFDFTMNTVPEHIKILLEFSQYKVQDIDFFAIHQANKQIVDTLAYKVGIPDYKYSTNTFTKYGNVGGISCLSNFMDNFADIEKNTNYAALISYGSGLSWASAILNIKEIYCSGIKLIHFGNGKTQDELFEYWTNKIKNYSASS